MGEVDFTLALAVGAFLLASWVDSQVGSSRPASPGKRTAHALVGVVLVQASVGALYLLQAAGASQAGLMAAVLALFLPALVYAMLGGLWLVRMLAELAGFARR
jgi:hypothetical protein